MGRRRNEHVYRVRWRREKWTCHRTQLFASLRKAEQWRETVRNAWPDGTNPITWVDIDVAFVRWEDYDRESPP